MAIGHLRDNVGLLKAAIEYLSEVPTSDLTEEGESHGDLQL